MLRLVEWTAESSRTEDPNASLLGLHRSTLLEAVGVRHGFAGRRGGVSSSPFDTLNFQPVTDNLSHLPPQRVEASKPPASRPTPRPSDSVANVLENLRRLRQAVGATGRRPVCVWQVHGRRVHVWPDDGAFEDTAPPDAPIVVAKADALVTADRRALLTVRVADCAPVLLADRRGRVVAAVHAGWRGVVAGVVDATIHTMRDRFDVAADDVIAAIGPCIGVDHFEVGDEVVEAFVTAGLGDAVDRRVGRLKAHVDLPAAIGMQLRQAGVTAGAIDKADLCTYCHTDEFFSHRRDNGVTGRMAAVIGSRQ